MIYFGPHNVSRCEQKGLDVLVSLGLFSWSPGIWQEQSMMMTTDMERIRTSCALVARPSWIRSPKSSYPAESSLDQPHRSWPTDLYILDYTNGWKTVARGQIRPMPVFANKGLLEHSHARSFMYYLCCFRSTKVELNSCNRHCMVNKAKNIYHLSLYRESFPIPGIDARCCKALSLP